MLLGKGAERVSYPLSSYGCPLCSIEEGAIYPLSSR